MISLSRYISTAILFVVLILACVAAKCPASSSDIKTAGRVAAAAAQGGIDEFNNEVSSGEMEAADAQFITGVLTEVRDAGLRVADDRRDFSQLSTADKRTLVEDYISYVNERAQRLQSDGLLHIKSDKSRKKFATVTREISRGLSIARIVEAPLPQRE